MKLLLKISYLGTAYCGYQVQPNGITVQQKLNEAAKALFGIDCDIVGCSRTDCGVHAKEFCASVSEHGKECLTTDIPPERIPLAFSAHLPEDIRVFEAKFVPDSFHARYDVKRKEYVYRIFNRSVMDPFEIGRAAHCPQILDREAVEQMNEAAQLFCGVHDFAALSGSDPEKISTVREIYSASVKKRGNIVEFRIVGNGFLYHMVRILAGTLIEVGYQKKTVHDVEKAISGDRSYAGVVMPACGLYLEKVTY